MAAAEADWEAAKENFQPLKTGRKAGALKVRESTADLRSQAIEERRRAFWEELAGYSGDDLLEVWLRFIKWTQETFSAGGHKAELLPLLERCTRELQADGRYASDIRYLRVWIQYADCLPDPGDVFAFLKENDIGQEHALYYIAFATYLEARGGYAKADAVYQQGINRLAAPVERLRAKFAEFQQRMARRIQRKAVEQAVGVEATEPDHPERRSLGVLSGRNGRPAASGARPGGGSLLGGGLLGKRKTAPAAGGDQENAPGGGLAIFVDDEFSAAPAGGGAAAASAPAALFQPGRSAAAPWTKLGGFEAGRKENVQRASVWAGQKLKQNPVHSAPAAPALEIFVDPELQELEEQAGGAAASDAGKPTLRQRLDRGSTGPTTLGEEQIMQNPLQLHKAQASVPPTGGLPGRPPVAAAGGAAPEAKRRREEVMVFNEEALIGSSGEELCFEEVRAARWKQLRQQEEEEAAVTAAAAVVAPREEDDMELEGDTCAIMPDLGTSKAVDEEPAVQHGDPLAAPVEVLEEALAPAALPAAGMAGGCTEHTRPDREGAGPELGSGAFGSPVLVEGALQAPSGGHEEGMVEAAEEAAPCPAAEAEPEADASLHGDVAAEAAACPTPSRQVADGTASSAEQEVAADAAVPAGAYEPTMTLNTRDAFAAINQMFGGALPADTDPAELFGGSAGESSAAATAGSSDGGLPAGLEPTMTIATKDAFAALNKMFKGSVPLEHGSLPPNPYAEPTLNLGRSFGGSGSGYEPTMTISTKAAFDAINQMFKGALPHEHGVLPPTARGPAAGYEPTMTISTKAAFDAINKMFGGSGTAVAAPSGPASQPQQAQGGFRVPAPRPPRARPAADGSMMQAAAAAAAPGSPASPAGGFCIREDTQFVSVPLDALQEAAESPAAAAAAAAAAPFGGDGGMGGFCIREDTQFITVPAEAMEDEEEEQQAGGDAAGMAVDAARQGQQLQASPGGGMGGFCIREDTQYITVAVQHQEQEEEEVQAVADDQQAAGAGGAAAAAALPLQPTNGPGGGGLGFSIREDTLFLGGAPGMGDSGMAGSPAVAADAALPPMMAGMLADGRGAAAAEPAGGSGFAIREDTQFLGAAGASPASPCASSEAGGSTGDLLAAELEGLTSRAGSPIHGGNAVQVSKWGFAPGADDTLALNLDIDMGAEAGDTQALLDAVTAAATATTSGPGAPGSAARAEMEDVALQAGMQGLQLADCKENVPVGCEAGATAARGGSGRRLGDAAVACAVLQPLAEARAARLGAEIDADAAAEAALAVAAETAADAAVAGCAELAREDSFVVWADGDEDEEEEGQQGPACSSATLASPASHAVGDQLQQEQASLRAEEATAGFVTPVAAPPTALVDPFSPAFHGRMLSCLDPAVPEWPGVYCLSAEEEEAADVAFRTAARSGAVLEELQLCGLEFAVSGCIGEGAYAKVYQGVDGDCADVALKQEAPPCPWEWYICKALAARVPEDFRHCFIDPTALLLGARSSVLVAPLGPYGSLQDLVNAYLARAQTPPECLAMHVAIDLLQIMQQMHAVRILHADIKPDNLLLTLGSSQHAEPGDENAVPSLGLQLIDFGRSVDVDLLPPGAQLQGDSGTDAFRCVEMREGSPWLWHADAYGVAASIYTMLYGRYMEVERVRDSSTGLVSLRPVQPLKRQWATELWEAFFHRLLNHTDLAPPAVDDLLAGFKQHLCSSREVQQRLRKELSAAATMLPRRC